MPKNTSTNSRKKTPTGKATATPEPGTREFAGQLPAGFALPDHYTNERVEELNEHRDPPTGVQVVTDNWTNRLLEAAAYGTEKPREEAERVIREQYPEAADAVFMWQSERVQKHRGTRGAVPVYDRQGRQPKVGNQRLYAISKGEAARRRSNVARDADNQAQTTVENTRETMERAVRDAGDTGVRLLREGEHVRRNFGEGSSNVATIGETSYIGSQQLTR